MQPEGLERGESKKYSGNYSYYIKKKAENKTQEVKNYYAQQKEIKKLETYIDKNLTRASTSKMAKSRRKKLEKIDRLDKPVIREFMLHDFLTLDGKYSIKAKGNDNLSVKSTVLSDDHY